MKKQILNTIGLAAIAALLCLTCDNGLDRSPTHAGDVDRFLGRINPTDTTGGGTPPTPTTYTLMISVASGGGGTVSPATGTHSYADGTSVNVTATASNGYEFTEWTGTGAPTPATTNPVSVTMNADKTLTANFRQSSTPNPTTYTLTTAATSGGTVSPVASTYTYPADTTVRVTATASSGYEFTGWTGTGAPTPATTNPVTVTMNASKTLTANFRQSSTPNPTTYTLQVSRDPVDGGNVTVNNGQNNPGQSTHNAGTSITVRAAASSGYTFQNWTAVSGSLPFGITATSANNTFNINSNVDIRANFQNGVVQQPDTGSNFTETVGGVAFSMVYVKGGPFEMGCTSEQGSDCYDSEKPSHNVTLSDYYVGRHEVTQGLWKAVMGSLPSSISSSYGMGDNYPVYYVSWNDVQEFIQKLNTMTGGKYRLPTEAEWEFAARGGNSSQKYKYSGSGNIGDVAWYSGNNGSSGSSDYGTKPVGTKQANELGIYDMSGNVWEWVSDWYGSYSSSSVTNPTGPASGSDRVIRGGGWASDARYCRVSILNYDYPVYRSIHLGFRLAVSP